VITIVSVSVAELLPGVGSNTPDVIVATFESEPEAAAFNVHVDVYVTVDPTGRVIPGLLMLPAVGPAVLPVAPPVATLVVEQVRLAGNVSATVTPVAALGPAFDATIVYVTVPPAVAFVTPSVFVMPRLADGVSVSVSVAELLPGFGSVTVPGAVTVAVFDNEPVAAAAIVAETV
jgi:hypothetical protein